MKLLSKLITATFLISTFTPISTNAQQTIVTTLLDENNGNGVSLRQAIDSSPSGSTITFGSSLDGETITLSSGQLLIDKDLTIDASGLSNGITINANNSNRILTIQGSSSVVLDSLTLTRGVTSGSNTDRFGGAIFINASNAEGPTSLLIKNSTITGNSAEFGGAIYNQKIGSRFTTSLTIENSTISDNSARFGGAIVNEGGSNGIACLDISNSTFSDNSAESGGAIFNLAQDNGDAKTSSINSTFSQNSAQQNGGAIFSQGSNDGSNASLTITHSTLSENFAQLNGGGIHLRGFSRGNASLALENSIVADNTAPIAPDLSENIFESGTTTTTTINNNLLSSLEGQRSLTNTTPGLVIASPLLSPLDNYGGSTYTMHPLTESPAILTGSNTTRNDQRGFNVTGSPTIGAVKPRIHAKVTDESSLRDALATANETPGNVICFDPVLDGSAINLTSTEHLLVPSNSEGLFIDASNLLNGLTIDGTSIPIRNTITAGVLEIGSNSSVAIHSLTLSGGNSSFLGDNALAGAIYINPNSFCVLASSTISNNFAGNGAGGIVNINSYLSLQNSTIFRNFGGNGGGILNSASNSNTAFASIKNSTITDNASGLRRRENLIFGGGIFNTASNSGKASLSISSSTIANNGASVGGGVCNFGSSNSTACLTIENSILTGASPIADLFSGNGTAFTTASRINLVSSLGIAPFFSNELLSLGINQQSSLTTSTPGLIIANPLLSPLGDYGGPTQTMLPLPGSPAIDAARFSNLRKDQRGFIRPIDGDNNSLVEFDLGAVEAPNWSRPNIDQFSIAFNLDSDGDGSPYAQEILLGTDPFTFDATNQNSFSTISGSKGIRFGRNQNLSYPYLIDVYRSFDLTNFTKVYSYSAASHTQISSAPGLTPNLSNPNEISISDSTGEEQVFYQLRISNE